MKPCTKPWGHVSTIAIFSHNQKFVLLGCKNWIEHKPLDNIGNKDYLYACGTDSIGVFFTEETGYIDYGGVAHGWCFTSGKIAGENAAAYGMQMNEKAEAA